MKLPLGHSAYKRTYARDPEIILLNRFFEEAPTNLNDNTALLARPQTSLLVQIGDGPIRANFSQPGLFNSDLFTVSATKLYRYDGTTTSAIEGTVTDTGSVPRMTSTNVGDIQRLFIADGLLLQYFQGPAFQSTLVLTPGTIADDVVIIDAVYYQFTSGSVDTGAPAGTIANPWKVAIGISAATALANLRTAINASGTAGTDYSTALVENPRVFSNANTSTTLTARARLGGTPNPDINVSVTAVGGSDGLAWDHTPMAGGPQALYGIEMPDGDPAVAVDNCDGYVLVLSGDPFPQRVYFLLPGSVVIDALNFFEAESEPDRVNDIICIGDSVWLFGQSSTDVYYATGQADAPFAKAQGRPFPIGGQQGTFIKLAGTLFGAGTDNVAYQLGDGPTPISTNGIAERLRAAVEARRT